MGQVFTWDAVHAGQIPKIESFHQVALVLREKLSNEPCIASALLFGSVVRGDFNIRSDIDCVVIYETMEEAWVMRVMHDLNRLARSLYVPINFTPCDTVLAKTRLHHLGVSFVRHLQASIDAGGLVKGDLVDLLAPTVSVEQEIESYIKTKMYNMQESFANMPSFSEERLAAFLKKALEAPVHVARKVLIYNGTLQGDSKKEVQERYRATMPKKLAEQFDHMLHIDRGYSIDLDIQLDSPDQEKYGVALNWLQSKLPRVIEFLRSNIVYLDGTRQ